jgi:hypothetical protein
MHFLGVNSNAVSDVTCRIGVADAALLSAKFALNDTEVSYRSSYVAVSRVEVAVTSTNLMEVPARRSRLYFAIISPGQAAIFHPSQCAKGRH